MAPGGSSLGAVAILPVRVASQRLPNKALLEESGQPLFLHTAQAAAAARCFDAVHVATDSDEVAAAATAAGFPVIRTSATPRTGSERCAEAVAQLPASVKIVVDVQGDWPEVAAADLEAMVADLDSGASACNTLARPLTDAERIADVNVVKVVRGLDGRALYFSRLPIPYRRDDAADGPPVLRHLGVYGFTRELLLRIPDMPSSGLAEAESLEQLRFLENGVAMHVLDASTDAWGIETRADYDAFLTRSGARGAVESRSAGSPDR